MCILGQCSLEASDANRQGAAATEGVLVSGRNGLSCEKSISGSKALPLVEPMQTMTASAVEWGCLGTRSQSFSTSLQQEPPQLKSLAQEVSSRSLLPSEARQLSCMVCTWPAGRMPHERRGHNDRMGIDWVLCRF